MKASTVVALALSASPALADWGSVTTCVEDCPGAPTGGWDLLPSEAYSKCVLDCTVSGGIPAMKDIIGDAKNWSKEQWETVDTAKWDEFLAEATKQGDNFWKDIIKDIDVDTVKTWTKEQWDAVPVDDLLELGWKNLQKIPFEEIGEFTQDQLKKIPVDDLVKLLGEQIAKLDAGQLAGLSDDFWKAIPISQISEFTAATFKNICTKVGDSDEVELTCPAWVRDLDPEKIGFISGDAWDNIPVDTIIGWSTEQLQSIDYDALGDWSKEQWDALPVKTLLRLTGEQISAVDPDVVGKLGVDFWKSVKVDQLIQFTHDQIEQIPFDTIATNLGSFTTEQYEAMSADLKAQIDAKAAADPDFKAILDKLKKSGDLTKAVTDKIKDLLDKKGTTKTAEENLADIIITPNATDEEIKAATDAVTDAKKEEESAAEAVDVAKTAAGLPTLEDEYSTNGVEQVATSSLAAAAAGLMVFCISK